MVAGVWCKMDGRRTAICRFRLLVCAIGYGNVLSHIHAQLYNYDRRSTNRITFTIHNRFSTDRMEIIADSLESIQRMVFFFFSRSIVWASVSLSTEFCAKNWVENHVRRVFAAQNFSFSNQCAPDNWCWIFASNLLVRDSAGDSDAPRIYCLPK